MQRFEKRKKDVLGKMDKSSKGGFDEKIVKLCEKINRFDNYYTTSSCAGRVVIIVDKEKKEENLFLKVYHDLISFEELKKDLNKIISFLPTHPKNSCSLRLQNNKQLTKNSSINYVKGLSSALARDNLIKFKQEQCILHVACASLKDAQKLHDNAKLAGWKRSGIIASEKRFVCELNGTEKLEFPIIKDGKILVDDDFLKIIVKKSNENLEKSWEKINKLSLVIK